MLILDSTVLITALDRSRGSFQKAQDLIAGDELKAVTTQTMRESLAVATRPLTANGLGIDFPAAWSALQSMRVACDRMLHETDGWWKAYVALAEEFRPAGRTIYDLGQVAHVRASGKGAKLVTDDAQLCLRYGRVIQAVMLQDL